MKSIGQSATTAFFALCITALPVSGALADTSNDGRDLEKAGLWTVPAVVAPVGGVLGGAALFGANWGASWGAVEALVPATAIGLAASGIAVGGYSLYRAARALVGDRLVQVPTPVGIGEVLGGAALVAGGATSFLASTMGAPSTLFIAGCMGTTTLGVGLVALGAASLLYAYNAPQAGSNIERFAAGPGVSHPNSRGILGFGTRH